MITEQIIDNSFVKKYLTKIFPSSIVLNLEDEIIAVSKEIKQIFYYNEKSLKGKDIYYLFGIDKANFERQKKDLLIKGYTRPKVYIGKNKLNKQVTFDVSGFNLGILSDFNSYIVLIIRDLNKLKNYQQQLENKVSDFNTLVYRTYHDLKGPIATIKGLTNISHFEKEPENLKGLINLIDDTNEVLHKRITNISSFVQMSESPTLDTDELEMNEIRIKLIEMIKSAFKGRGIEFCMNTDINRKIIYGTEKLLKILNSILNAARGFEVKDDSPTINLYVSNHHQTIQLNFHFSGFHCDSDLKDHILLNDTTIADSIINDEILRFYILKNTLLKVSGFYNFNFPDHDQIELEVLLPIEW